MNIKNQTRLFFGIMAIVMILFSFVPSTYLCDSIYAALGWSLAMILACYTLNNNINEK